MTTFFKAKNLCIAVLAVAAIAFVASREAMTVRAAGTGSVVAVPWMGSEALFHEVTSGGQVFLQAVGTDVNGNALTGISTATWDSGDGNPVAASMPLGNGLAIERTVTYSGSAGQPFTATVRVTMTNGDIYTDTMNIRIAANTRETRVNMAIDKALWYLHKRQVRTTVDGKTAGYWTNTCCSTINNQLAGTAPAVQAFEINNHRESGDRLKDPYVDGVKLGLRFILSATTGNDTNNILRSRAKVMQGANNPDGNNNLRVLNSSESDHSIYLGGQVMDALVASGTPNKVADVGEATWVMGQSYSTIVQDLIDGYSQGQNDDKGGWLYTPNDGLTGGNQSFDISSSHWWGAGVLAAQGWNLDAPLWIKNQLKNNGFPNAHTTTAGGEAHAPAAGECHWHYRGDNSDSSWDNYKNVTPAGLILMNAAGVPKTDVVWKCTEKWIANRFASTKGNPYSMYQTTKGMRTAFDAAGASSPVTLLNGTIDWYAEYADYIVAAQNTTSGLIEYNDGGTASGQIKGDMQTAWNVIILSPSLFELPPQASCSASPATIGKFGGTVNFSAAASFYPDATETITGYAWNFGDATAAGSGVTTSHAYAIPASFPTTRNATVTVTASNGISATASCPVTIVNNNVPPAVTITGPYTVCQGSPLTLIATAADEDGTVGAQEWDLNTPINFTSIDATGLSYNATAFFASKAPGAYNIGFRAFDNDGATSSAFSTVTVLAANDPSCNQPPTIAVPANILLEATSPAGAVATFTATATDDHDTITPVCTPPSGSTFGINPTTSKTTAVNCTATDSSNLSASGSFNVTVQDTTPPVITIPANISVHATSGAGAVVNYTATAADIVDPFVPFICTRPSGETFQLGVTTMICTATDQHNNRSTATFTINVTNATPTAGNDAVTTHNAVTINVLANDSDADGDSLIVQIMGGAQHGNTMVNPDKTVTYTPFQNQFFPSDSFTYQINDGRGGFATATVSITMANVAPVAVDDVVTLAHNQTTITIPLLTNDTDADGDALFLQLVVGGVNAPGSFTTPTNAAAGTVTYTAAPNFFGPTATLTYTMNDGHGGVSNTATVTINFTNAAPVAVNDAVTTHNAVTINVLANDSDADGDPLTVSIQSGAARGSLLLNADKTITYTPFLNQPNNGDSFSYKINDGHGGFATATVSITVTNAAPVAVNDVVTLAHNQTSIIIPVLGNDTDSDGDTLSIAGFSSAMGGTLQVNGGTTFTYTPAPGFFGPTATFTYSVKDGHGGTSTPATVTVNFTNEKPTNTPYAVTTHGEPVTVNVLANASDPDGDTVKLVFACGIPFGPPHGNCQFNVANGTVTFAPFANWFGPTAVVGYTVNDGHGASVSNLITITYVNQLPVPGNPAFTTLVNTPLLLNEQMLLAGGTDPDGDPLSIPEGVTVQHGTLVNNGQDQGIYTPNPGFIGVDTLSFVVDDDHGGLVNATATITVTAPTTTTISSTPVVYGNNSVVTVTVGSAASSSPVGTLTLTVAGAAPQTQVLVNGSATFTFAGLTAGPHSATASYVGQDFFLSSEGAGTVNVSPAPTTTVVTCTPSVVYNGAAQEVCTATVTSPDGFSDTLAVSYQNNVNIGTATGSASYAGDNNHTPSSGSATFTITQAATSTAINAPTITVAANGAVTVTVSSGSGTVLGSVSLTVDGGAAMTQALVGGSTVFTVASPDAGDHALAASYTAQGNFSASGATGNLHVNPSPTATTLTTSATPQLAGTPVIFTATVVATTPGSGTPNGIVTFLEGATVLGTGTLNGAGVATFTTTTLSNGPHTITASYDGVNNYLPSQANTVSKLIFGLATGGGTFVIGNNNAIMGNAVHFWGAQWEKNNSMTGGSSNASFKGFAISPAVPTVGATFTSAPGNSAPPPSGVPQYLGIIVTSKVTKSGSNITGTIVKLVVVLVNPGYQGNPGHAGTGTIVAFVQ